MVDSFIREKIYKGLKLIQNSYQKGAYLGIYIRNCCYKTATSKDLFNIQAGMWKDKRDYEECVYLKRKKKVVKEEVDVAFITDWNLSESSKQQQINSKF